MTAIAERTDHPNMRPSGLTYLYLAIMLVIWASNWPLMKLALADAPPLMFVFARLIGTLAVLVPVLLGPTSRCGLRAASGSASLGSGCCRSLVS